MLFGSGRQGVLRPARAIRRLVMILLWTLFAAAVQSVCILLPGRPKVAFARLYWSVFCRIIGLGVQVAGQPVPGAHGGSRRPVVFVSNHSSWLDVPVLGGRLEACFISKDDVARWPLVSTIARLGRTVFISRQRTTIGRERDGMIGRLARGDNLILFPEGTTSDGSRVLPFRSAFFAIAGGDPCPLIQPVSVVYDRLGGLPAGRACRPLFAWYGDMDIASHFWRLAQHRGLRATVLLHAPLDPARFANRKALADAVWATVAEGAASLRQNRPARPIDTEAVPATAGEERRAYA
jgi:1-acyl-sn-glycerol-3-phosphate acyltransferase